MKRKKLILIDAGLFCVDMHIRTGIYYLYNGTYVLLCKNEPFTDELIKKLQVTSNVHNGLYINENDYAEVWNESLRQYSAEALTYEEECQRAMDDYSEIIAETFSMLSDITTHHDVSIQSAQSISSKISEHLDDTHLAYTLNCINMIHQADNYLYTHSVNVATLNGIIAKWLELPDEYIKKFIQIGLLHDLGKLRIPPHILDKPGRLTNEEFQVMQNHPVYSYEILWESGVTDQEFLLSVRQHHEKANGFGYPDGLTGDEILLPARVTAISDIYDAMVSKRCYKNAVTPFEVMSMLGQNRFSDLDTRIVNIFLENIAFLMVGMPVTLSNGEKGEVVFLQKNDYANPVVKVGERIFSTTTDCRCVTAERSF